MPSRRVQSVVPRTGLSTKRRVRQACRRQHRRSTPPAGRPTSLPQIDACCPALATRSSGIPVGVVALAEERRRGAERPGAEDGRRPAQAGGTKANGGSLAGACGELRAFARICVTIVADEVGLDDVAGNYAFFGRSCATIDPRRCSLMGPSWVWATCPSRERMIVNGRAINSLPKVFDNSSAP